MSLNLAVLRGMRRHAEDVAGAIYERNARKAGLRDTQQEIDGSRKKHLSDLDRAGKINEDGRAELSRLKSKYERAE